MPKKTNTTPKPSRVPLRPILAATATVGLVVAIYFAIVWLGERSREAVASRPRFTVNFSEIVCETPPGMDRATFLTEVRYLANPPLEFSSADAAVPPLLAQAFAKHPWVLTATPSPEAIAWPRPVKLEFRVPSLAVKTTEGIRVVDAVGVLLPSSANVEGLPIFSTIQVAPERAAGERWRNPDVLRALDLAKDHQAKVLEKQAQGWRIELKSGQVLTVSR